MDSSRERGETASDAEPRTARERMLAGEPRRGGGDDPELAALSFKARRLVAAYNQAPATDQAGLDDLLRQLLGRVGDGARVRQPIFVDFGEHISIGARSFVNSGLTALDVAPIVIGEDVQIGPNVQLLTPTHPLDPEERLEGWETGRPVTVGDNVWLGGGVVVLPGVSIGDHTVVGAGAVVTRDLPPRVLAVGSPARVIRRL